MLFRRSTYALYCLYDAPDSEASQGREIFAFSVLTGRPENVTLEALAHLQRLPADRWLTLAELESRCPEVELSGWIALAERGLVLVAGSEDARLEELHRRHERLDGDAWNGLAATYHFMGRWQDAHTADNEPEDQLSSGVLDAESAQAFLARHGQAPTHFHTIERPRRRHSVPAITRSGGFWDTLARRRTSRHFEPEMPVSRRDFATVLRYVFGCHGVAPMFDGVHGIKKTSPSGGGLHPIEIYPLVVQAEGLQPGLYHYNLGRHALDEIETMTTLDARALANELTAGQRYTSDAGVLFLMTARFFRNFWKYRRHDKAYGVLLMDAAHLSQTLYLVCAELGLGAFFTAAINGRNIERRLGIDGYEQGALAICGMGHAASGPTDLEPRFGPFVPALPADAPERGQPSLSLD